MAIEVDGIRRGLRGAVEQDRLEEAASRWQEVLLNWRRIVPPVPRMKFSTPRIVVARTTVSA